MIDDKTLMGIIEELIKDVLDRELNLRRYDATTQKECVPKEKQKKTYTTQEAAEVLGVGICTMYKLLHSDGFPAIKVGSMYLIPIDRLDQWLNDQCAPESMNPQLPQKKQIKGKDPTPSRRPKQIKV